MRTRGALEVFRWHMNMIHRGFEDAVRLLQTRMAGMRAPLHDIFPVSACYDVLVAASWPLDYHRLVC